MQEIQEAVLLVSLGERFDNARAADMGERLTTGLAGVRVNAFAALNYDNLTHDMAFGGGDYLSSLGTLLGVPDDQRAAFFQLAQTHYTTFTQSENATPVNLLAGLDRSLAQHGIVTTTAANK